ncbi:tripartite tricarboxylate transporter TctB family protein [Vibrio furnissii]|uniref:tripartite tricarboxylate transporter TctB family protein n=1 Tax=Vibrio furnissii TaxID=29494 RepID=UPI001E5F8AF4|nr:tripartite tricarboxylate transporter TctB family protein [Vibrio furnissii]MCG6218676.1 tripartite tricarboxylate transporter TctB family protein [Vibrio furnissii]UHJ59334.1 tripartite tricarboxylate transporter TctB family protein [Vibrio furnissii]
MDVQSRKPGELVFNALMVVLSLVLLYQAFFISDLYTLSSPGAFPLSAAAIMLVFSAVTVWESWKKVATPSAMTQFFQHILPGKVIFMMALIGGFALCLESVGFIVSALIFLSIALYFLHQRRVTSAIGLALVALVAIYVVFRLVFLVILPEGVFPEAELLSYFSQLMKGDV